MAFLDQIVALESTTEAEMPFDASKIAIAELPDDPNDRATDTIYKALKKRTNGLSLNIVRIADVVGKEFQSRIAIKQSHPKCRTSGARPERQS